MHVLRDAASVSGFLLWAEPELGQLIRDRLFDLREVVEALDDLGELLHVLVVEPGDRMAAIEAALGFALLVNRWDGSVFGTPGFSASWEDLVEHRGWYELLFVLRDDGFGILMFISKQIAQTEVLRLCAKHARPASDEVNS